jgi:hypothetical protein
MQNESSSRSCYWLLREEKQLQSPCHWGARNFCLTLYMPLAYGSPSWLGRHHNIVQNNRAPGKVARGTSRSNEMMLTNSPSLMAQWLCQLTWDKVPLNSALSPQGDRLQKIASWPLNSHAIKSGWEMNSPDKEDAPKSALGRIETDHNGKNSKRLSNYLRIRSQSCDIEFCPKWVVKGEIFIYSHGTVHASPCHYRAGTAFVDTTVDQDHLWIK